MSDPNATQVGGSHYQSSYQHWDFVRIVLDGRYLEGCASKYASRWRKKNGLQDLMKLRHYVEKIRSLEEEGAYGPAHGDLDLLGIMMLREECSDFCDANLIVNEDERTLLYKLAFWKTDQDLCGILTLINQLIAIEQFKS